MWTFFNLKILSVKCVFYLPTTFSVERRKAAPLCTMIAQDRHGLRVALCSRTAHLQSDSLKIYESAWLLKCIPMPLLPVLFEVNFELLQRVEGERHLRNPLKNISSYNKRSMLMHDVEF